MREIVIAALLATTAPKVVAGPYGAHFGYDEVYGVVESGREAPRKGHPPLLAEIFEHVINPETAPQLVQKQARLPEPGQRRPEANHQPPDRKEQS
jgi:hypothetical protein